MFRIATYKLFEWLFSRVLASHRHQTEKKPKFYPVVHHFYGYQVSFEYFLQFQTADIQNDFFTSQFLVPFPTAGLYSLLIEAQLVDSDGHR
jgi:hypothetical protein